MILKAAEFKDEYQILFSAAGFDNDLRYTLNRHINVTFPGLEEGVFKATPPSGLMGDPNSTSASGHNFNYDQSSKSSYSAHNHSADKSLNLTHHKSDPTDSQSSVYDIRQNKQ